MDKVISLGSILGDSGPAFYTVAELANVLRLSQFTIRRSIWSGRLEAKMLGNRIRIPRAAVERFLAGQDWSPEMSRQRAGRPKLRGRRPKVPAVTPAEPVAEVAPASEPVSLPSDGGL